MKSYGVLALLLIAGGGLIYSATQQPRYMPHTRTHTRMQPERPGGDTVARMAHAGHFALRDVGPPRSADGAMADAGDDVFSGPASMHFLCKLPAEMGPVPLLGAVDAWLRAAPDRRNSPDLVRNLRRAARQGNWLAKVQVVLSLNGRRAPDDTAAFGTLTLGEWMQEHPLGVLRAAAGKTHDTSGPRDTQGRVLSSLDFHAAMHHHYPSQYKVGRALLRSGDAQQAAVGRQMLDCAARALPVYAQRAGSNGLLAQR
jgi:hypothetical protein